jgi:hypothetical protein
MFANNAGLDVLADAVFVATHGLDAVAACPEMMLDEANVEDTASAWPSTC